MFCLVEEICFYELLLTCRSCKVVTLDGIVHLGQLVIELIVKMNSKPNKKNPVESRKPPIMNKESPSLVTSPSKGGDRQGPIDKPIHVVTVPVNNKDWKPVKQVRLNPTSNKQSDSVDQSKQAPLSGVGKQMISELLHQAKTLHEQVLSTVITSTSDYTETTTIHEGNVPE